VEGGLVVELRKGKKKKNELYGRIYQNKTKTMARVGFEMIWIINWPLHDIVSLRGFCARVNHPFIPPPTCIARTIAILLHVHCAIYDALPTPLVYAIHHTILPMAISCKGQIIKWKVGDSRTEQRRRKHIWMLEVELGKKNKKTKNRLLARVNLRGWG